MIRPAAPADLATLPDVERAAGRLFAGIGMTAVAEDEPPSPAELAGFHRAARVWVAVADTGAVVGYALAEVVDGDGHLAQVSVDPAHGRRGHGRALVAAVVAWSRRRGHPAVTLTTFAEVPWNGPYYRRLGFRPVAEWDLTPGLRAIRAAEADRGLDRWPRLAMRYDLGRSDPP